MLGISRGSGSVGGSSRFGDTSGVGLDRFGSSPDLIARTIRTA